MPDGGSQIVGVAPANSPPLGFHESKSFGNVVSCLALVLSAIALWRTVKSGNRTHRVAVSESWVKLLLEPVVQEIVAVRDEADLVRQLCTVPFETVERKTELRSKLQTSRETSAQRIYMLLALCPQAVDLQLKRATLSSGDDSFFENGELLLPRDRANQLVQAHQAKVDDFLKTIRALVKKLTNREYHPSDA